LSTLAGRVAVITGAGRGIGREHALLFAAEGAQVVVNDVGGSPTGEGVDPTPAESVVAEIRAAGGSAVANASDVADADGAQDLIDTAISEFGRLDVLVNNAGILRDRMIVNMSEAEWDDIMRVHLRGHFLTTRAAARHWRERTKSGEAVRAALINTSSTSGLFGNAGQSNYGAAKTGIATFTTIAQMELERYGVRCNAIAPAAFTRLTEAVPGSAERRAERRRAVSDYDVEDPSNIAPFVAYLATEDCPIAGQVFYVHGATIHLFQPWTIVKKIESDHPWTVKELQTAAAPFADVVFDLGKPY
jgi:NAD(P)-dependent dehydrogenase (short-subunit alcohol dehydrogenase family)